MKKVVVAILLTSMLLTACTSKSEQEVVKLAEVQSGKAESDVTKDSMEKSSDAESGTEDMTIAITNAPQPGEAASEEGDMQEAATEEKVKLDRTKFENLDVRATQMGYEALNAPERFSNGFVFKEFMGIGEDKLRITYMKEGVVAENEWNIPTVDITITPKGEKNYKAEHEIQR